MRANHELSGGEPLPLVTFALITFNQEQYVEEAIRGALAQTYEPLEIIISDDTSSDRTYEVITRVMAQYEGPHKILMHRNSTNLGLIAHVNSVCQKASGRLIVVAAGDDISSADRVAEHVRVFTESDGPVHSIHSSVIRIDLTGREGHLWRPPILKSGSAPEEILFSLQTVFGATHSWSKEVFERFGPIKVRQTYEDLVMVFRASLLGGVRYIDKPLVRYRIGSGMSTDESELVTRRQKLLYQLKLRVLLTNTARQRAYDCWTVGRYDLMCRLIFSVLKDVVKVRWQKVQIFMDSRLVK